MKKHLLIGIIICLSLSFFIEKVSAQYGAEYGPYLNYALTKRYRHPATKRKMKRAKRTVKSRKRNIKRKKRQVSAVEILTAPKFKAAGFLPRKSEIV
jgi:hypothetical protein